MESKTICCIGAGYVGGPTMAVIALKCPDYKVVVVDINKEKIDMWNGDLDKLPVYEPGLKDVVEQTRNKNLFFSNEIDVNIKNSSIIFVAVNTPTKKNGYGKGMATDLSYVIECSRRIAKVSKSDKIVIEKSTAPIGTAQKIKDTLYKHNDKVKFDIISNPEFLAEGSAINDLLSPDRVLIGCDGTPSGIKASNRIFSIYNNWISDEKILTTNLWSSELSKLASNAFLAQRISSINSLSALCEESGANIEEVSSAVGMDSRIGNKFLKVSVGFGGSCFKKDILNLVYLCRYYKLEEVAEYWIQVLKINDFQKNRFYKRVIKELNNNISDKVISVLGWAFKKDTNDSRESASIDISDNLIQAGANLQIYDPMVNSDTIIKDLEELWISKNISKSEIKLRFNKITVCNTLKESFKNSSCICILTEWDEFKDISWNKIIEKPNIILDGRNILNINNIKNQFEKIISIGK